MRNKELLKRIFLLIWFFPISLKICFQSSLMNINKQKDIIPSQFWQFKKILKRAFLSSLCQKQLIKTFIFFLCNKIWSHYG